MTGPDKLSPNSLIAALSRSISAPSSDIAGMLVSAVAASGSGRWHAVKKAVVTPAVTAERQK
jgi:hypothetical protein